MRRRFIWSGIIAIGVAACGTDNPSAQPASGSEQAETGISSVGTSVSGQSWSYEGDLFGYFLPQEDIAIGSIQLDHISLAAQWEVEAYIAGEPGAFPPLTLSFDDVSSPTGIGELGNTYYEVSYHVQPDRFEVTDSGIRFSGEHDLLGEVRFQGAWDRAQIAEMMAGNPQNAQSALTGNLVIGDVIFEDVTFQGWLGD